jgi:hypothetical protein
MSWVCPYCKRQHNNIAQWTYVNGHEVRGFCSDSCLNSFKALHDNGGSRGGGSSSSGVTDADVLMAFTGAVITAPFKILGGAGKLVGKGIKTAQRAHARKKAEEQAQTDAVLEMIRANVESQNQVDEAGFSEEDEYSQTAAAVQARFCGDCGTRLEAGEKFCGNCGAKL